MDNKYNFTLLLYNTIEMRFALKDMCNLGSITSLAVNEMQRNRMWQHIPCGNLAERAALCKLE